ncbi:MAG: carboxypeptidase-like regulatory domain-containing protein [Melioribacteraceae bacterium]
MNKTILLFILLIIYSVISFSQNPLTQTVRGTVIDKQTETPLPGAFVILLNSNPLIGASTDINGIFRLEKVPVGRQNIQVSYMGYNTRTLSNLMVNSGKELILKIELEEDVKTLSEVTIKADIKKDQPINNMAKISARFFTIEETERYAGSFGDPARMAVNFAGVMSGQGRNDIIIRGNSPLSVVKH